MPQIEQTPANKLYRYAIGAEKPSHNLYSLAEFWELYRRTFDLKQDAAGYLMIGAPREVTVTLIAPWGELVVYPLPGCIGLTRSKAVQDAIAANQTKCSECESWFAPDQIETLTVDGDTALYCEACKEDLHTCDRCSEHCTDTHTVRTGSRRRDDETWCELCKDDHAQRCEDCRDWFGNDCDGMSHGSDWYCESCSENYSICDTCGTLLSTDNQYSDNNGDGTYCERHQPSDDEDSDNEYIHDYSYKPRPIFHGAGIHYGVELEVTCDRDTAEDTIEVLGGDSHVFLKDDSSIQGGGYEIVTHPHTLDSHRKLWAGFNDYARRKGFKANSNGMHVHIDRAKLSPYRIAIMQRFINRDDNRAFIGFIAQRSDSSWAKCNPDLAKMRAEGNGERYSALNLNNAKTVELRIFRGTIRKSEFFKNLEFCDALVQWSIDRSHAETSVSDFAVYVRANRKVYPALDAFMTDGGHLPAMPVKKEVPACV